MADFVGSTSALIKWCAKDPAQEFIVMTESGVRFSLEKLAPGKKFYFVANENCNCSECPYMKLNTLEKLRDCLANLEPRVELSDEIMRRALLPIERMLALPVQPPRSSPPSDARPTICASARRTAAISAAS